eukprot:gb/GEZN01008026.1/.p1 GENE.gb/GEZN01008026.1/~~gb/GEZN01008026.1/.p1  ORF type:complete len:433 (+),score=50.49 gb/GEZN01008026.1/:30-1328(+)
MELIMGPFLFVVALWFVPTTLAVCSESSNATQASLDWEIKHESGFQVSKDEMTTLLILLVSMPKSYYNQKFALLEACRGAPIIVSNSSDPSDAACRDLFVLTVDAGSHCNFVPVLNDAKDTWLYSDILRVQVYRAQEFPAGSGNMIEQSFQVSQQFIIPLGVSVTVGAVPCLADSECYNSGTCLLTDNSYSCVCASGFQGARCEASIYATANPHPSAGNTPSPPQSQKSLSRGGIAGIVVIILFLLVLLCMVWYTGVCNNKLGRVATYDALAKRKTSETDEENEASGRRGAAARKVAPAPVGAWEPNEADPGNRVNFQGSNSGVKHHAGSNETETPVPNSAFSNSSTSSSASPPNFSVVPSSSDLPETPVALKVHRGAHHAAPAANDTNITVNQSTASKVHRGTSATGSDTTAALARTATDTTAASARAATA